MHHFTFRAGIWPLTCSLAVTQPVSVCLFCLDHICPHFFCVNLQPCEFIFLPISLPALFMSALRTWLPQKRISCHIIGQYYANNIHPYSFPLELSTIYSLLLHQYEEKVSFNSIMGIFKGTVYLKMKILLTLKTYLLADSPSWSFAYNESEWRLYLSS